MPLPRPFLCTKCNKHCKYDLGPIPHSQNYSSCPWCSCPLYVSFEAYSRAYNHRYKCAQRPKSDDDICKCDATTEPPGNPSYEVTKEYYKQREVELLSSKRYAVFLQKTHEVKFPPIPKCVKCFKYDSWMSKDFPLCPYCLQSIYSGPGSYRKFETHKEVCRNAPPVHERCTCTTRHGVYFEEDW